MDTVVIVLLVLLGVIVLTKGKPLWLFLKQKGKRLWSFVSKWVAKYSENLKDVIPSSRSTLNTIFFLILIAYIIILSLFGERVSENQFILSGLIFAVGLIIYLVLDYSDHGWK